MKQVFKQYRAVAAMLAAILLLSVGLTVLTGGFSFGSEQADGKTVLATTYPIYVAAQRIIGDDDSVTLTRLDGSASGCLHDYQLSPADRRALQEADVILTNGVGAESFLSGVVDGEKCVDTSSGLDLLCSDHHHDHGGEEHHHEKEKYNEHLWLSPSRYQKQVLAVLNTLISLNKGGEEQYRSNAENYFRAVDAVVEQTAALKTALEGTPCVLFHDSMTYLATDLGLDVKLTLSVEGESGLSAHDLGQVEALAAQYPDLLLFYDTQYALRYEGVGGTAATIRTAVQEDWLIAMNDNVKTLQTIVERRSAL